MQKAKLVLVSTRPLTAEEIHKLQTVENMEIPLVADGLRWVITKVEAPV